MGEKTISSYCSIKLAGTYVPVFIRAWTLEGEPATQPGTPETPS